MLEEIIAPISAFLYPAYYVGDNMKCLLSIVCLPCASLLLATLSISFYLVFTTIIDICISILWKRILRLRKVQECLQINISVLL